MVSRAWPGTVSGRIRASSRSLTTPKAGLHGGQIGMVSGLTARVSGRIGRWSPGFDRNGTQAGERKGAARRRGEDGKIARDAEGSSLCLSTLLFPSSVLKIFLSLSLLLPLPDLPDLPVDLLEWGPWPRGRLRGVRAWDIAGWLLFWEVPAFAAGEPCTTSQQCGTESCAWQECASRPLPSGRPPSPSRAFRGFVGFTTCRGPGARGASSAQGGVFDSALR